MTMLIVLTGAAVGAPCRYLVSRALNRVAGFPWGTWTANVVASFVLGLVAAGVIGDATGWRQWMIAFCGSFSTYSALAVETTLMGRWRGLVYAGATVLAGLAAAVLGWWVG